MSKAINEEQFIYQIEQWVYKTGVCPVEKVTFLYTDQNEILIAINSYDDYEPCYLSEKAYRNYQSAMTKIGALFDKANIDSALDDYQSRRQIN